MRLPSNDVLAALDGTVVHRDRMPATIAVSTDTRAIRPSETFLALRGERFDGHRFVGEAVANGASVAIVDDASAVPEGVAGIVVADTLQAYLTLGRLARARIAGPVIAISGSTGKTTTKAFTAQAIAAAGRGVLATPENENNEIGVAKFLLSCEDGDERVVIVEMGARSYRDLDPLIAAARPDVAVLTNIGEAHLEIMGSRERLADTKWGLFSGGALAVLNLADGVSRERAATLAEKPLWFGIDGERPDGVARAVVVRDEDILAVDGDAVRMIPRFIDVPGDHNRRNVAAALAAAWAVGMHPADIATGDIHFVLPEGRYQRIASADGPDVIYDAYNASMSGAIATLATFARERAARRIAILGSMAELGADAAAMHERVGATAARAADIVLVGGTFADAMAKGARSAGIEERALVTYATNDDAVSWLRKNAACDDLVLLKGSRMYHMEQIVAGLRA